MPNWYETWLQQKIQLIKTIKSVVKLTQEYNPHKDMTKNVDCFQSAMSKILCKYKKNEVVKKKNIQVDQEKRPDKKKQLKAICLENMLLVYLLLNKTNGYSLC